MSPEAESQSTASTTSGPQATPSYKRGYVACDGCRARKVRCVLGNKPPCAKCVREHRECVFQTQKKSGRHREIPKWAQGQDSSNTLDNDQLQESDDPRSTAQLQAEYGSSSIGVASTQQNTTPSGVSTRSDRQPGQGSVPDDAPITSDRVMTTFLTKPSDALDVLFDAAQPRPTQRRESRASQAQIPDPSRLNPYHIPSNTYNVISESGQVSVSHLSQPSEETLDLWDRFRFVRQGWFTAQEAVTYLDLLYTHLAPVSPVLADTPYNHSTHHRLITEEPMLCCTLLMIASRFFILPGAGGTSRSHAVHSRLWQYCELLIRRIMLGQEKLSTAKTRVIASIESLILISDWPPRSLHLPPESEGWDSELISPGYDRVNRRHIGDDVPLIRWREDVFEPAKRSERMSWMLLGAAVNLGYEIGVFGDNATLADPLRAHRVAKLLYVNVTQMAVNMGTSSLLPDNISLKASAAAPGTPEFLANEEWERCMRQWIELTRLMKTASAMFFQSAGQSQQQLQSGHYSLLLEHFEPSLTRWEQDFTATSANISDGIKSLVLIEYHYLKTYTSALSVQAVVERAVARNVRRYADLASEGLESCILPHDYKFISNVVTESTKVLEIGTAMASVGRLRFAPHRTLLSITSSSIFLLKAISLGARNADLHMSLGALDRCIKALRSSGTDDMDFSLRYATLLERHVARFRENFFSPYRPETAAGNTDTSSSSGLQGNYLGAADSFATQAGGQSAYNLGGLDREADDQQMNDFDPLRMSYNDDWWARPFDPNIAPFRTNGEGMSLRLELDSLDFLWNLPLQDGG